MAVGSPPRGFATAAVTGIAGRLEWQERTVSWPRRLEPRARGAGRAAPPVKAQGGGRGDVITYTDAPRAGNGSGSRV